jgi:CubicO group peptidase (beta-lactamase class C family)
VALFDHLEKDGNSLMVKGRQMFKKIEASMIHGLVSPAFKKVEQEFRRNFAERGEVGAACAIYYKGKKVVDVWGGYRDPKTHAPWEEDTLVCVFSATKGMAAMAVAVAHSHGLLDYDEKVATYWPEFAQRGKENVTVRQLLSHQAGLSAIDEPLDLETMAEPDALAAILARQAPAWVPGTRHGYHMWSIGWYMSELVRRVDPHHRTLGQFFQDELARPLNLEFYIGLPSEIPDSRMARIIPISPIRGMLVLGKHPYLRRVLNPLKSKSITYRTVWNPKSLTSHDNMNRRDFCSVEIPSENGIGLARSMAKAYSVFATGGKELNLRKKTIEALAMPAIPPSEGLRDEVMLVDNAFLLGFNKPFPGFTFGTSDKAFGFAGASGAFAFADPDAQVGYAYARNKIDIYGPGDPREKAVRRAFYSCL